MKRLRHYDKDLAVVLSVFGSSEPTALEQYIKLKEEIRQNIPEDAELRLAISSRTVLKNLEKKGEFYQTLAEHLANLDRLGYKNIVVGSINLFPTEEHEYVLQIADAFRRIISISKYEISSPIFTKSKLTSNFLYDLDKRLREEYKAKNILYMAHGAPNLNSDGSQTFIYIKDYLKLLNKNNYFYTIEGAYQFKKELFLNEFSGNSSDEELLLVPLLLVAGNHMKKDINEMKESLAEKFSSVKIPENFMSEGEFCLLKLDMTKQHLITEVKQAVQRIQW